MVVSELPQLLGRVSPCKKRGQYTTFPRILAPDKHGELLGPFSGIPWLHSVR